MGHKAYKIEFLVQQHLSSPEHLRTLLLNNIKKHQYVHITIVSGSFKVMLYEGNDINSVTIRTYRNGKYNNDQSCSVDIKEVVDVLMAMATEYSNM